MNIHAKRGHKITVTEQSINNGYDHDKDTAKAHLKIGNTYTVERTNVDNWHTTVYIQEVPNVPFNSVNFIDFN